MTTTVEKVAQAIRTYGVRMWGAPHLYGIIKDDFDAPIMTGLDSVTAYNEAARLNARAAIEAMREPSPTMVKTGVDFALRTSLGGDNTWPRYITEKHHAKIDAALKEGDQR